jgi:hypothetical protein
VAISKSVPRRAKNVAPKPAPPVHAARASLCGTARYKDEQLDSNPRSPVFPPNARCCRRVPSVPEMGTCEARPFPPTRTDLPPDAALCHPFGTKPGTAPSVPVASRATGSGSAASMSGSAFTASDRGSIPSSV